MSIFKKKYLIEYRNVKLDVEKSTYHDGRIRLQSYIHKSSEPFATLTTNIESYNDILDKDDILLDCNNVPGIDKILMELGLVGKCLGRLQSGYCTYPIHKWLG